MNSDQAIVIQVDSMASLKAKLAALEIWDHEQVTAVREYATSDDFQNLLKTSGLSFDVHNAELHQSLLSVAEAVFDKSLFITINANPHNENVSWMLVAQTDAGSVPEVKSLLDAMFSMHADDGDATAGDEIAEPKIHPLPASLGHWFLSRGFVFVFGQRQDAADFAAKLDRNTKPKRSFADSRKFLNATSPKRTDGFGASGGNVTVYFDPSIATQALPFLPEKLWDEFQLDNITGSLLQVSFPDSDSSADAKLKIQLDGMITYKEPLPRIHQALLAASEIDELPPFPPLLMDLKAVSFDFEEIIEPLQTSFENTYGERSFEKALQQIGLIDSDELNVISEFPRAFSGTFVQARYLDTKTSMRGGIRALRTKNDGKATEFGALLAEGINQKSKRKVLKESEEYGGTCWFITNSEIEFQKDAIMKVYERQRISARQRRRPNRNPIPNRDELVVRDVGFAVAEGWLFEIQRHTLADLVENRQGSSNESLEAMLTRLRKNSDVRPIALWSSWPYYWKIRIASAIWNLEKRLRTKGRSFDMSGFDMKLRPLEKVKTLSELATQLQIRASMILVDRVGKSMITMTPQRNGFRIAGGLFAPNKGE